MAQMTNEMMEVLNNMAAPYLATASKDGVPNVVPCGSTRALSPDTITITALHLNKTLVNLEENPKVAMVFHTDLGTKEERREAQAWQIRGRASLVKSGDIFERAKENAVKRFGEQVSNKVKAAVLIKVEEIYNVVAGPDAGRRVA